MRRSALAWIFPILAAAPPARAQLQGKIDDTDPDGRRSIRGGPVEVQPNESPELNEMRRFEERAFPRPGAPVTMPPRSDSEGAAPGEPLPDQAFLRSLKPPDLPVRWDIRVLRYLQFYKSDPKGRAIMTSWLRKQGRWRALMDDALRRHDLPRDLIFVSMIESGYEPTDLSRVGASGLWQFMDAGGRIYGLEHNYWVDERRHPERSTEAAMIYLGDLQVRFGHWHMALAAFNAGYGAVLRAMQKYNTNDYWELCKHESGLPWETCNYVSKAIATAIVGENRAAFGYDDPSHDEPVWSYDRARVPGGTPLGAVAHACGQPDAVLAALNPELRRGRVPPGREWELRIPRGTLDKFAQSFAATRKEWDHYDTRLLKFGERLEDVARSLRVSVKELKRINGVTDSTELRGGTEILVPREKGKSSEADLPPEDDLPALVAVPERTFSYPDRKRVFYRTRDGDTPESIAEFFGVTKRDLATWNHLDLETNLASKMVLQLFVARDADLSGALMVPEEKVKVVTVGSDEFLALSEAKRGRKRSTYVCRTGDTLLKVGRRFGLTPGDLARINQFSYASELRPGQQIVVYVPVTPQAKKEAQGRLRQAARLAAKFAPARKRAGSASSHRR